MESDCDLENKVTNGITPEPVFSFRKYFHNFKNYEREDKRNMLDKFRPKKNIYITNSVYKVCPRSISRIQEIKMTKTSSSSSKNGICFICGGEFLHADLSAHEKICLDSIQKTDDIQYTRQNTDDSNTSSISHPMVIDTSNSSTHSSGSTGESSDKKHVRCYICGTELQSHLKSIHEKSCKKKWESGLVTSISTTPSRKSNSKGDLTATKSSSLTRTTSRSKFIENSLQRSKSTTNLWNTPKKIGEKRSSIKKSLDINQSRSTTNLSQKTDHNKNESEFSWVRTKSLHDVSDHTKKGNKKTLLPKYVECQLCGKQYSEHSIGIHRRQCEKTRDLQKVAGTDTEYKKKSKSLMDLSGYKRSTPSKIPNRPSATPQKTANPPPKVQRSSTVGSTYRKALSVSMGNISKIDKNINNDTDAIMFDKEIPLQIEEEIKHKSSVTSPALQKCYLCGQLYGKRSLPIHEKQCMNKWEREKLKEKEYEQEKKNERKNSKKEFKLLSFGKTKTEEIEKSRGGKVVNMNSFETPEKSQSKASQRAECSEDNEHNKVNAEATESANYERNFIRRVTNAKKSESDQNIMEQNKPTATEFVLCVFCGKQYGVHSITIHEKNCRERRIMEEKVTERVFKSPNERSKSLSDNSAHKEIRHGDVALVTCNDCNRKFLSGDIEKHTKSCRMTIS